MKKVDVINKNWTKSGICNTCGGSEFSSEGIKYPCGNCAAQQELALLQQRNTVRPTPPILHWDTFHAATQSNCEIIKKAQQYVYICLQNRSSLPRVAQVCQPWILLRGPSGCGKSLLLDIIAQQLQARGFKIWSTSTYQLYEEFKHWRTHGGKSFWQRMQGVCGIFFHDIGLTNFNGKDEKNFWLSVVDTFYRGGKIFGGASREKASVVANYIEPSRLFQRSEKGYYVLRLGEKNLRTDL